MGIKLCLSFKGWDMYCRFDFHSKLSLFEFAESYNPLGLVADSFMGLTVQQNFIYFCELKYQALGIYIWN